MARQSIARIAPDRLNVNIDAPHVHCGFGQPGQRRRIELTPGNQRQGKSLPDVQPDILLRNIRTAPDDAG
jgi:hypothetical protein